MINALIPRGGDKLDRLTQALAPVLGSQAAYTEVTGQIAAARERLVAEFRDMEFFTETAALRVQRDLHLLDSLLELLETARKRLGGTS